MASFNNLTAPSLAFNEASAAESGVITLYGSFQGNGTANPTPAAATATSCVGYRGNWFTVTRVTAGQFRVTLVGLNVRTNLVAVNTTAGQNGQPNGLLAEPKAWTVSDGAALSVQSSTAGYLTMPAQGVLACSRFDPGITGSTSGIGTTASAQSFDIFTCAVGTSTPADPTANTRVCFELAFKALAPTP